MALDGSKTIDVFDGDGNLDNTNDLATSSGLTLAAGDNLLVFRVTDKTDGGSDEFDLWLNPDLDNPGAADYQSTTSTGLVVGNSSYGFDGFNLYQDMSADSVLVDEFRLGESFADVTPVPEPASLALIGMGTLCLLGRRRSNG